MSPSETDRVRRAFESSAALQLRTGDECVGAILEAATMIEASLRAGGKVLLCGNGGSAADCQHMAAEFVGMLRHDFQRPPMAAVALTTDTSVLTGYSNDIGFDSVFARQVEALGRDGDVLVCISTSGASANVLAAARAAAELGLRRVALMGAGGELAELVDVAIRVPSADTQLVQEALLTVEHTICELVEQRIHGTAPAS
jgi:phosphoheptose isomerase